MASQTIILASKITRRRGHGGKGGRRGATRKG